MARRPALPLAVHNIVVAVVAAAGAAAPALAQCDPAWLPGLSVGGVNGPVHAITAWDPDGPGPLPEWTVVAGQFTAAGDQRVGSIAAWDGQSWHNLAGGVDGPLGPGSPTAVVHALAVYEGDLIAAGLFTSAGGVTAHRIARFDGSAWHPVGGGLPGSVSALTVHGGELVAGGAFTDTYSLARWNGVEWSPVACNGTILALTTLAGDLVAAGQFASIGGTPAANIARFDGQAWHALGSGVSDNVRALAVYDGALVAGGTFLSAGGAPANRVARWDGAAWSPLGGAVPGSGSQVVSAAAVYGGDLYIGGSFATVDDGVTARSIARWDGAQWSPGASDNPARQVNALAVVGGRLVAGGQISSLGGVFVANVGATDGDAWTAFGGGTFSSNDDFIAPALAVHDGELYVGSLFWTVGPCGGAANVARWLGTALDCPLPRLTGQVSAMVSFGGDLIVGGRFTAATDAGTALNIARWDGDAWRPMGDGLNSWGVNSLTVHAGHLIAAGDFQASGQTPIQRIARWNGASWEPLAATGASALVRVVASDGQSLYAGGNFLSIGGVAAAYIARFDGQDWHPVGAGLPAPVADIVFYEDQLIAAGLFAGGAARFDAATGVWVPMSAGVTGTINALAVHDGALFAAEVYSAPGARPGRILRWNGEGWEPIGPDLSGPDQGSDARALIGFGSELVMAGIFTTAGGHAADGVARWTSTRVPTITIQPRPASAPIGGAAAFTVAVAPGYEGVAYQWRRGGVPVADGPTPSGSIVSGAATPTLAITAITPDDAATYDCVVTSPCGDTTTLPASLAVGGPACPADWNKDTLVNSADITAFLTSWLASVQDGTLAADFNGDNAVNSADITAFLGAWLEAVQNGGC